MGIFQLQKFAGFVWGGVSKIGGPITKSGGGEGQSFRLRPRSTPPSGETLQVVLAKFPQCTRKKAPRKLRRGNGYILVHLEKGLYSVLSSASSRSSSGGCE